MNKDVRILLVEDNSFDAELIMQDIQAYGQHLQVKWAETKEAYIKALEVYRPELILSDFMFPDFDGFAALELAQKYDPRVPFIIVTGSLSEEVAADCIKKGAWDYVLKERLARLIPAIENALVLKRERMALDEQQRQNEIQQLLYQSVVTLSQSGIVVLDEMGLITMANRAFSDMVGLSSQSIIGKRFIALPQFIDGSERLKNHFNDVLSGRPASSLMLDISTQPRRVVDISSSMMQHDGSFIGVQVFIRDVSERIEMIEQLRQSRKMYAKLFDNIDSGVLVLWVEKDSEHFSIADLNQMAASIDHLERGEVVGKNVLQVYPGWYRLNLLQALKQVHNDAMPVTIPQVQYNDGRLKGWRSFYIYKLFERQLVCVFKDITAAIAAQQEIEVLSRFPEESPNPILRLAENGELLYANAAGDRMLAALQLPENHQAYASWNHSVTQALEATQNHTVELRFNDIEMKVMMVPVQQEKYLNVYGMDVTIQKRQEKLLEESQEQLKLLNKIMRHDLTNNMASLKSGIRLYRRKKQGIYLDQMNGVIDRSLELINAIRGAEHMLFTDHPLLAVHLDAILEAIAQEHPEVFITGCCNGPVIANTALPSLFENLVQNALVHGKATRVELKVTPRQTMCEIQVRDNGSGIPERIQPRIFDEGFHFGKTGQSGLGLYISRKLVERYGGTISVVDNQPTGAVLIVELVRQM